MRLPTTIDAVAWMALFASASVASNSTFQQECSSFPSAFSSVLPNATIWFSEFVTAGTNLTFPDNAATCKRPSQVVSSDMCRIALRIPTSNRSEISMEAWLPSNWTGRFLSAGNPGTSGCISYEDMAYTAGLGFATVGTNNGHNGSSGEPFYNNPDVVTDFAYRSIHMGVVAGKEISQAFYGKTHTKSYYLGCSTGGRQGFKSAQAFPDDFDGIVAGAPAFAFNNLTSWAGHFHTILGGKNSTRYVPKKLWTVIHQNVLEQCDGIDGAVDGIIEDPTLCQYRPEALICASNATDTSSCLTADQAEAVRLIFSDLYSANGALMYPRMQPGSEIVAANGLYAGAADMAYAAAKNPANIQSWDGDLSHYRSKGGKILHYHGLMDDIINSENSPRYYNHVSHTMGLHSHELDEFYRLFRISGMGHCNGGDGAWVIGNQLKGTASLDPDANVLMAMVRWVEKGVAPTKVIGTKWVNDIQSLGVDFTRAHCKYPHRNVYTGTGDVKNPDSWKCVAPTKVIGTKWVNNTESLGVDFTRAHCRFPHRKVYTGTGDVKDSDSWKCVAPTKVVGTKWVNDTASLGVNFTRAH